MPFLQKLEHLYNGLIRLLTILLTLALLGVAFKAALDWRRATEEPASKAASSQPAKAPKVAAADVVKRVVANQSGTEADVIGSDDPNRAAYDRMSKAIQAFEQKHAVPAGDEDPAGRLNSLHYKVEAQDTDALKAAYANGLADALEQALADPKIDGLIKPVAADDSSSVSAVDIVSDVVDQYDAAFLQQNTSSASHGDSDLAQKEKQDAAWRSLLRAGGPILLLILVLQLLTFGRIERNTRGWSGENRRG